MGRLLRSRKLIGDAQDFRRDAPRRTEGRTLTERFRRVNYGRLEIDLTIDDPKAYTKPWTVRVNHRLSPSDQLIEFICNENEKSSKHYVR